MKGLCENFHVLITQLVTKPKTRPSYESLNAQTHKKGHVKKKLFESHFHNQPLNTRFKRKKKRSCSQHTHKQMLPCSTKRLTFPRKQPIKTGKQWLKEGRDAGEITFTLCRCEEVDE